MIQTAWIGDVVLTTPLLAALAAESGPVDVVVTPDAAPLLDPHPAVGAVLPYDKRGRDRGPAPLVRLARTLRGRTYARAVLAQGSHRSAMLAVLARIPRRVVRADAPGAWLGTDRRTPSGGHEAERLLALADRPGPARLALGLTASDHEAADRALHAAGVHEPFVALAPGSARATKRWPHFGALARALAPDGQVAIIGTRGEFPADARGAAADLTGLPLRAAAAVLARARVAVTNDSAALHLAQAAGTTTVALFGPTHPRLGFGPRGPHDVTLGIELDCRPCSTHGGARCPRAHHRCLHDLAPATVAAAVRRAGVPKEAACE